MIRRVQPEGLHRQRREAWTLKRKTTKVFGDLKSQTTKRLEHAMERDILVLEIGLYKKINKTHSSVDAAFKTCHSTVAMLGI